MENDACFMRSNRYGTEYLFGKTRGYSRLLMRCILSQRNDGQLYEFLDADANVIEKWISVPRPRKFGLDQAELDAIEATDRRLSAWRA